MEGVSGTGLANANQNATLNGGAGDGKTVEQSMAESFQSMLNQVMNEAKREIS